ncbi:hypothetical protein BV898_01645 [Hypsibius exemplaris]|uniref:Uncharacterized protein n=1 Tax=Hypsibius exemplaris TaxID=2072580 RepID=A0A1W0XAN2_HYPEX|nr:hypothetical protein BV898_01645 [Hypsibius exemplaris]
MSRGFILFFVRLLAAALICFLCWDGPTPVQSIAFRSFRDRSSLTNLTSLYPNCSTETALATFGCPCALLGQPCYSYGSYCNGPAISDYNRNNKNYLNGNIKVGICGCGTFFKQVINSTRCIGIFAINATAGLTGPFSALVVDGCVGAYSAVPGLNMTSRFGTPPIQFLLAVVASTNAADFTPYIGIDATTLEVYLLPFASSVAINQTYSVLGIDANNQTSNPVVFDSPQSPAPVMASIWRHAAFSFGEILHPPIHPSIHPAFRLLPPLPIARCAVRKPDLGTHTPLSTP